MDRNTRIAKAHETLKIIEEGTYAANNNTIDITEQLNKSLAGSVLHRAEEFSAIMLQVDEQLKMLTATTKIDVANITVLQAASQLTATDGTVGCLNFASAKNAGGGFLNGAVAQEESLALSSTLYATQMKNEEFYLYNRVRKTYLYSDHMIYSPGVTVFRDDSGTLLTEPYMLDIITSPAVNIGAMKNNNPDELQYAEIAMLQRTDRVLGLFVHYGIRKLVLGAWGCGVFQNDPVEVAKWFATYLKGDGKYSRCFDEVLFAVYDRSKTQENIGAFEMVFGGRHH